MERQQMNHHYRRLSQVKSTLQTGGLRRSKSVSDFNFDQRLTKLEKQLADHLSLPGPQLPDWNDRPVHTNLRRGELFDTSLDVMRKNARYFTRPSEPFTPSLVRKIVRPSSGTPKRSMAVRGPSVHSAGPSDGLSRFKLVRMPSDDSAFDEKLASSDGSSPSSVAVTPAAPAAPGVAKSKHFRSLDFQKWLRKQEEEASYLQLLCDVTADLLQRKLCTNGAIKDIIGDRIRSCQRTLRCNSALLMQKLCQDLLIPVDPAYDRFYYGSTQSKLVPNVTNPDTDPARRPLEADKCVDAPFLDQGAGFLKPTNKLAGDSGKRTPSPVSDPVRVDFNPLQEDFDDYSTGDTADEVEEDLDLD